MLAKVTVGHPLAPPMHTVLDKIAQSARQEDPPLYLLRGPEAAVGTSPFPPTLRSAVNFLITGSIL